MLFNNNEYFLNKISNFSEFQKVGTVFDMQILEKFYIRCGEYL